MTDSVNPGKNQVQWIKEGDQEILSIELDHVSEEQAVITLKQFVGELSGKPAGSVLLLAILSHAGFNPELALKWQGQQKLIHSQCARMAVVGAHGIIAIAANTFLNTAKAAGLEIGKRVQFFENADLAKAWLAKGHEKK